MEERFRDYLQKVFVPRFTSAGHFPKSRGIYFVDDIAIKVAYYEEGLGFVKNMYSKDKIDIRWWLEEIELPNEKQIEKQFPNPKITDRNHFEYSDAEVKAMYNRRKGAKWFRDFVLAVTPNEVQK